MKVPIGLVLIISCLFLYISIISLVSAKTITINYPANVTVGSIFQVNLSLVNYSEGVYDIKIDILNSSDATDRLSEIYNGLSWQTTYNYVGSAINTTLSNSSLFLLNITKNYNSTANITVKIRKSSTDTYEGYQINVSLVSQTSPTCSYNAPSCSSWSICLNNIQNKTCVNYTITPGCINLTYYLTQSCSSSPSTPAITLNLEWKEEDIINGDEFDIDVNAFNLQNYDYDLKIFIHFEDNNTIISDRYDDNNDEWKSGTYYLDKFFSGIGNKTKTVALRIRKDYSEFHGDVKIYAKIVKNSESAIVAEKTEDIEIKEESIESTVNSDINSNNILISSSNINSEADSTSNDSEIIKEIISLGSKGRAEQKKLNSIIYKSKTEYIKEYAPYIFGLVCIFIIAILLIDKKTWEKKN